MSMTQDGGSLSEVAVGTLVLTVMVGVVGAVSLYQMLNKGPGPSKAKVVHKGFIKCSKDRDKIECTSDLLRNREAIYVVRNKSGKREKLTDLCTELDSLESPVSDKVVSAVHAALCTTLEEIVEKDTVGLVPQITSIIIQLLTVTPSMDCILDAKLMPPAMYQPCYSVIISKRSVRCVSDGFVGPNVKGPAHPDKKYTDLCMRLVSDDLVRAATSKSVEIKYCVKETQAQSAFGLVEQSKNFLTHVFEKSHDDSESDELWNSYLIS